MTKEVPKLLTDKETAALLGLKTSSLAVWRCSGKYPLPFVKVGRLVRYKLDDVLRFIEQRTVKATLP